MTLDNQTRQLDEIKRGVYGDPTNKVKGLMGDMEDVKSWIVAAKLKITFFSGIGVTIGFLASRLWEWLIGKR